MSYSQILLIIRSQRHDERVHHELVHRIVDERRRSQPRPSAPA